MRMVREEKRGNKKRKRNSSGAWRGENRGCKRPNYTSGGSSPHGYDNGENRKRRKGQTVTRTLPKGGRVHWLVFKSRGAQSINLGFCIGEREIFVGKPQGGGKSRVGICFARTAHCVWEISETKYNGAASKRNKKHRKREKRGKNKTKRRLKKRGSKLTKKKKKCFKFK